MSGTTPAGSYSTLLRRPAVARTFALALVGRLTYGVLPLTLLFTVQQASGSFAHAAGAMALNGLASLTMPAKARAIDRHGQRRVLPLITAAMVFVLLASSLLAHDHLAHPLPWLALGLAVGLASPPLGPSMRAQWRVLAPPGALARAYSLDAVGEETLYLVGPMIAAGLLVVAPAYAGMLLCAGLVTVGALGLAASPAAVVVADSPTGTTRSRSTRGPLRHHQFWGLLATMAVVGAVISTVFTSTAARALDIGHPSYAGLADAGVAVGSVLGGLLWGRLQPNWRWERALAGLVSALGAALLVGSITGAFWVFAAALAVGGVAISPIHVVAYGTSDRLVSANEVTEASTWINTVTNLGISLGGASCGVLVAQFGAHAPAGVGAVAALALAGALAMRGPSMSRPTVGG